MLLLDSDVLIDIQRGYSPAVEWFANLAEPPLVPGLVVMELIQDAENREQVERARKLVAPLPISALHVQPEALPGRAGSRDREALLEGLIELSSTPAARLPPNRPPTNRGFAAKTPRFLTADHMLRAPVAPRRPLLSSTAFRSGFHVIRFGPAGRARRRVS